MIVIRFKLVNVRAIETAEFRFPPGSNGLARLLTPEVRL